MNNFKMAAAKHVTKCGVLSSMDPVGLHKSQACVLTFVVLHDLLLSCLCLYLCPCMSDLRLHIMFLDLS